MSKLKWRPLRVLFVGDEPSSRNVCPNTPFVGTPSYKRLLRWIGELDLCLDKVILHNGNGYTFKEMDKIVYLGQKAASRELDFINLPGNESYIKIIDHPSPRNRNFNEPGYEAKMLRELKNWLYS